MLLFVSIIQVDFLEEEQFNNSIYIAVELFPSSQWKFSNKIGGKFSKKKKREIFEKKNEIASKKF